MLVVIPFLQLERSSSLDTHSWELPGYGIDPHHAFTSEPPQPYDLGTPQRLRHPDMGRRAEQGRVLGTRLRMLSHRLAMRSSSVSIILPSSSIGLDLAMPNLCARLNAPILALLGRDTWPHAVVRIFW